LKALGRAALDGKGPLGAFAAAFAPLVATMAEARLVLRKVRIAMDLLKENTFSLKDVFIGILVVLFSKVGEGVAWVWKRLMDLGEEISECRALVGILTEAFTTLSVILAEARLSLEGFRDGMNLLKDATFGLREILADVFIALWDEIEERLGDSWTWILGTFASFKNRISLIAGALGAILSQPFEALRETLDPILIVFDEILETWRRLGEAAKGVSEIINAETARMLELQRQKITLSRAVAALGRPSPEAIFSPPAYPGAFGTRGQHLEVHIHVGALMGNEAEAMEFARLIEKYRNVLLLRKGVA
jgi:hypothetical protein